MIDANDFRRIARTVLVEAGLPEGAFEDAPGIDVDRGWNENIPQAWNAFRAAYAAKHTADLEYWKGDVCSLGRSYCETILAPRHLFENRVLALKAEAIIAAHEAGKKAFVEAMDPHEWYDAHHGIRVPAEAASKAVVKFIETATAYAACTLSA